MGYGCRVSPRVYLETSVVSYLVGRLSRDVIVLGNQELTREWWASRRGEYSLFISEVVVGEASIGDTELARQRLALAKELPLLAVTEDGSISRRCYSGRLAWHRMLKRTPCIWQSPQCMGWTICSLGTVNTSPMRPFDVQSKSNAEYPAMSRR